MKTSKMRTLPAMGSQRRLTDWSQAFENTSTNVAAAQMRNALTNLAETVKDPEEKKVSSHPTLTACSVESHHNAN